MAGQGGRHGVLSVCCRWWEIGGWMDERKHDEGILDKVEGRMRWRMGRWWRDVIASRISFSFSVGWRMGVDGGRLLSLLCFYYSFFFGICIVAPFPSFTYGGDGVFFPFIEQSRAGQSEVRVEKKRLGFPEQVARSCGVREADERMSGSEG